MIVFSRRLGEVRLPVDIGDMNQQGHHRETIILLAKTPGGRLRAGDLGDKTFQGIEHWGSPNPARSNIERAGAKRIRAIQRSSKQVQKPSGRR
jgi:hypothetical protein